MWFFPGSVITLDEAVLHLEGLAERSEIGTTLRTIVIVRKIKLSIRQVYNTFLDSSTGYLL